MYIEFSLPHGSAGQAAAHANRIITLALAAWAEKYNILYATKLHKYMRRVTFDNDAHYSLFAITWNPDKKIHALGNWRIVCDLNNKIEFNSVL